MIVLYSLWGALLHPPLYSPFLQGVLLVLIQQPYLLNLDFFSTKKHLCGLVPCQAYNVCSQDK